MLEPQKMAQQSAAEAQSLNRKVLDHAEENVREAFKALRAAAGSTSVTDVMKAQGDYVKEQSQRSMAQAKEIGDMIASFGRSAMSGWGMGGLGGVAGSPATGDKSDA